VTVRGSADTALLIQGHQNDLLHEDGRLWSAALAEHAASRSVVAHIAELIRHSRQRQHLVVHGLFVNDGQLPNNAALFRGIASASGVTAGSWGAECLAALAPEADDVVVHKCRESPFVGTPLDLILRQVGVRRLILAGATTSMGIETAARAAADLGYHVVVPEDACADPTPQAHDSSIRHTLPALAGVTATATLLAS